MWEYSYGNISCHQFYFHNFIIFWCHFILKSNLLEVIWHQNTSSIRSELLSPRYYLLWVFIFFHLLKSLKWNYSHGWFFVGYKMASKIIIHMEYELYPTGKIVVKLVFDVIDHYHLNPSICVSFLLWTNLSEILSHRLKTDAHFISYGLFSIIFPVG